MAVAIMAAGLAGRTPVARGQEDEKDAEVTLKVGDAAPKLQCGRFVHGEPVTVFEKDKVYVVEFWQPQAWKSRLAIPELNDLWKKYQDKGLVVIGLTIAQPGESAVVKFIKKMGSKMTYRIAMDDLSKWKDGAMSKTWMDAAGEYNLPVAFVVGKDGKIAWIGHPTMGLDKVVDGVLDGTYDPKNEAEVLAASRKAWAERRQAMQAAVGKLKAMVADKKWDEALGMVDEIEKTLLAGGPDSFWTARMHIFVQKKDNDGATKLLARLGEKYKDDAVLLNETAWVIATAEEFQSVLPWADKLAARANELCKGDNSEVLCTMARIAFMKGDKDQAIAWQKKAIALADDDEEKDALTDTLDSYKRGTLPSDEEEPGVR